MHVLVKPTVTKLGLPGLLCSGRRGRLTRRFPCSLRRAVMRRSGLASLNPTLHKLRNLAPGCVLEALALALDALVAAFPRWALGAASKPRARYPASDLQNGCNEEGH